jgi:hypothetical protein
MKLRIISRLLLPAFVIVLFLSSCVKEGPMGLTGPAGADGKDGVDANETCKMCHTPAKVDLITTQFAFSKHEYGEAAFEEAGNTGCTPCHGQEAFKDVVKRNVPSTYIYNATAKRYDNQYLTSTSTAYGEIGCSTCHSSIHATYGSSDLPSLTTVAPVSMVMWGGGKTINLPADGGMSNLCVKCHQPRSRNYPSKHPQYGNAVDYDAVAANPTSIAFDSSNPNAATNIDVPSYRMHIHYGAVGGVYAGMGGVEFPGTLAYTNSTHTTAASCKDCHMGTMYNRAGGHTFTAKGNLTTCNATGCHTSQITASDPTYWTGPRNDIKGLLNSLAAKLTINGVDILNRNGDTESNLWYGLTTNNYDGYLNIMDMQNNPSGPDYNATMFQNLSAPTAPNQYWSQADIDKNKTLPKLSLTYAQYGALINFQLCLRDYSLGIHNYKYTKALLTNSIAKL